jgi:hypothetical protein
MKTKLTPAIKKQFSELQNQLSPENLSCDGELSRSQARSKHKEIMVQWWALEDKIGMKVNAETIEQWFCKRCGTNINPKGYCQDETCPHSDRLQSESFTEE